MMKTESNQILKKKKEALRQQWQKIFKIQPENNIEFDEENGQLINQYIKQHLEEFQNENTIEFSRLNWENP